MNTRKHCFERPRTPADLVVVQRAAPRIGTTVIPRWQHAYPEGYARLTLSFKDVADSFENDSRLLRQSSPLFWHAGTPAQLLLWARCGRVSWSLSLTCWGVLRWECQGVASQKPIALESPVPLHTLVNLEKPFQIGVTLAHTGSEDKVRVQLLAGTPEDPLAIVSQAEWVLPAGVARPGKLIVGQGPRRALPARARMHELLLANTERYPLYQGKWQGRTGVSVGGHNQSGLACRVDDRTVLAYPGVTLESTTGNYWHHLVVTDPKVECIRFPACNGMATRFFGRGGGGEWAGLPVRVVPQSVNGMHGLEVLLPRRKGAFHVANCPAYDEAQREADLVEARRLGAVVHTVAASRGGLPVHMVELTNPAVPLRGKIGVMLVCGQHSPVEQMTGFLGIPLLRELVRLHKGVGRPAGYLTGWWSTGSRRSTLTVPGGDCRGIPWTVPTPTGVGFPGGAPSTWGWSGSCWNAVAAG